MLGLMCRSCAILAATAFFAFLLQAKLNPEAGASLIRTFAPNEYSANQQNWAVIQDSRGVVYVGNNDGVLQYDGVSWRKIPLTIESSVRSLAIDSAGRIYVGGRGIFGFLAPNDHGVMKFVSLLENVPPTDRSFNDIWDLLPTSQGIYFSSYRRLFFLTPQGSMKVYRPTHEFGRAFLYRGSFFITDSEKGLMTMKGGSLTPAQIQGDPGLLHGSPIFAAGSPPLITYNRRLYRVSSTSVEPFVTSADRYFQEHEIYSICQLPTGDIAVGTKSGGLVFLDQKGELERVIRKTEGLPSNYISAIYPDGRGGVWLATDTGLARISTVITRFGESQGIHGNVYAIARLAGTLYVGTSLGLFRMHTVPGAEPVFTPVPEVQEMVLTIVQRGDLAFVGTERGLWVSTNGGSFQKILSNHVYDVGFARRDSSVIYTAGGDGLQMLRKSGNQWTVVGRERGTGQDFRSVAEAQDGRVWGASDNAIWRVDFSGAVPKSEDFAGNRGVPDGLKYATTFQDHVVFVTEKGLYSFSEMEKRFIPDNELGDQFSNGGLAVSSLTQDAQKNIWITGKGYHGILSGGHWFNEPMLEAGLDQLFWVQIDGDGTAWASGVSGTLFRYKPSKQSSPQFGVLLRNAILTNENSPIFSGEGAAPQPRLPYRDNALRFEYAAPFIEGQSGVQYQVRLVGSDSNWSAWTSETRKDYTNLPEGSYSFEVRARSPHGVISPPASFRFSLAAPWYRTWWAYATYGAAFLFAGWLILRWRLQALEARNKWLESVVEERTAEVRSERDQNEALLLNILPRPVASELRSTGSVKPTSFDDVTVCFTDFVGFTLSSEKLPPEELITSLNRYFTAFDEIVGRYGLEKLKTIGDAYMFAGGLPNASSSHAVDAVLAALEMVEVVRNMARPDKGINWSIRLGLYSGPVVAGVVGVRKFAFDIWGNTVNFAARMESAGSPNKVNLSQTTSSRVAEFIECEPRGLVRIKEGREMEMYFAIRLKPELMSGPRVDGIPQAFRAKYEQVFAKPPKSFPDLNGVVRG